MNRLFDARRAKGISREALAKAADISPRTIERYEQGRSDLGDASYKTVKAIAAALGVDPEEII